METLSSTFSSLGFKKEKAFVGKEEGRRRRRVRRQRTTAGEFSREHGGAACEGFVEKKNRERA